MKGNWKKINLISLANYINGFAFKPSDWDKEGVPIIRIEQINGGEPKDFYNGSIPENNRIYNGNLIFSWSATLKVVIWNRGFGYLNQHLFKVIPKKDTEKYFLKHLLDYNMIALGNQSQGSTMKHIKRSELDTFNVQIPKKRYQQKIAKILNTVDAVIEKTEQAITKYQAINKGMTHDLFTRGIDLKTRQLRPSYKDAPELYKKSTLGMIPEEWEVERLDRVAIVVSGGTPSTENYDFWNGDILWASPTDITKTPERIIYKTEKKISKLGLEKSSARILPEGTLLMTSRATLGEIKIANSEITTNQGFKSLIIKEKQNKWFYFYYMSSQKVRYSSFGIGTTFLEVNKKDTDAFLVINPKLSEQIEISNRLCNSDSLIEKEQKNLSKHQNIKKGLMQDLLTAKVEVTV